MTGYTPGDETQPPGGGYPPSEGGYPPSGSEPPLPPPGHAPPQQQKVRPGRIWYLVPLALFVASVAWLVVGVASLVGTIDDLQRVPLPAGGAVHFEHSGGYTVYYEGPGAQSGNIAPFHVNITPVTHGAAVSSLTQYGSSVTYDYGSHHGRAVLALHVSSPGEFAVKVTGTPAAGSDLAFGGSIAGGIVGTLLPALPLLILGILGLVVLFIIRIVRTRNARRGYGYYG